MIFSRTLVMLIPCAAVPTFSDAAQVESDSKVTSVTVYEDRALITRSMKVTLQSGDRDVVFANLPAALSDDSVTAAIRAGSARIQGLELKRQVLREAHDEKIRSLEKEIEQHSDKQRELTDRAEVDRKQLEFADKLQVYQIDKASKELAIEFGYEVVFPEDIASQPGAREAIQTYQSTF